MAQSEWHTRCQARRMTNDEWRGAKARQSSGPDRSSALRGEGQCKTALFWTRMESCGKVGQDTMSPPLGIARKSRSSIDYHETTASRGGIFFGRRRVRLRPCANLPGRSTAATQGLNYGWHLATVAAEDSPEPEANTFKKAAEALRGLYGQTIREMRSLPAQ